MPTQSKRDCATSIEGIQEGQLVLQENNTIRLNPERTKTKNITCGGIFWGQITLEMLTKFTVTGKEPHTNYEEWSCKGHSLEMICCSEGW